MNDPRGSIWRKWDLKIGVHTEGTEDTEEPFNIISVNSVGSV